MFVLESTVVADQTVCIIMMMVGDDDDDDDGDVRVANMNVKIIVCKARLIRASQAMMWTPVIGLPVCTVLCWSEGVAVNKVPVLLYR